MSDLEPNKHNLLYFEKHTMRELYACLEDWQNTNLKRFLSISIHQDGGNFCCIALTNPMEVTIVSGSLGSARVSSAGELIVWNNSG
jgi:hypothetical protein